MKPCRHDPSNIQDLPPILSSFLVRPAVVAAVLLTLSFSSPAEAQPAPAAILDGLERINLLEVLESVASGSDAATATLAPAGSESRFTPLSRLGMRGSVPGSALVTAPFGRSSLTDRLEAPSTGTSGTESSGSASSPTTPVGDVTGTPEPAKLDLRAEAQQRLASVAQSVAGRAFPYHPATNGGAYGCAQVVSTILRRAGTFPRVTLDAFDLRDSLLARGWFKTSKNQFMNGDVVFWSTYDWNGDGRRDADTHVGVIVMRGNTPYVVQNSSSMRRPVMVPLFSLSWPITNLLRMKP
jgi:hypothetical protein